MKPDEVITTEEELEDATPPPPGPPGVVVESPQEYLDGWNKRSSKVALAYPIVHGDASIGFLGVIGPHEACVHCLAAGKPGVFGHQLHLKTSRDRATGRWLGPDAGTLEQLREVGALENTPQAAERRNRDADVAQVWGIEPREVCAQCGVHIGRDRNGALLGFCENRHRNGLPELRVRTADQIRKTHREYRDGQKSAMAEESSVLRAETERLAEAMEKGVERALARLAKNGSK